MSEEDPDDFGPPPFSADEGASREGRGFVADFVRKAAVAGLGALFMTEEGIRNLAGQLKLPKEVIGALLQHAERTKDDVQRVISEELRRFLQSDKLREEFIKVLSSMTVEVKAEIRLKPRGGEPSDGPDFQVTELSARKGRGKRKP